MGLFKIKRFLSFRMLWIILLILLLIPGFAYPILGTISRVNDRMDNSFKSLDGTKYMETTVHHERGRNLELKWDLDVIRWFQSNVKGTPVVLEAHTSQYFWGARIANYTGLPTILGWPWHQRQQRTKYGNEISERERAIKEIYSTSDIKRAEELLDKYGVQYIVVGQLERALYPHRGTNKFSKMNEQGLIRLAYSNDEVNVYERRY